MPDEHAGSFIPSKFQVQAEDLRFLNSLSLIIPDSDLRSDLLKRSGLSGRAFLTEFKKEGAKATAGDKTLVVTNLESYALSGHVGALTLASFNSFLKNFYKLQRATPPSSRKSDPAIFEMIKMVACVRWLVGWVRQYVWWRGSPALWLRFLQGLGLRCLSSD